MLEELPHLHDGLEPDYMPLLKCTCLTMVLGQSSCLLVRELPTINHDDHNDQILCEGLSPFGTGPYDAIFRLHAQGVFDMVLPCVACDFEVFARHWRVLDPCQASFM